MPITMHKIDENNNDNVFNKDISNNFIIIEGFKSRLKNFIIYLFFQV